MQLIKTTKKIKPYQFRQFIWQQFGLRMTNKSDFMQVLTSGGIIYYNQGKVYSENKTIVERLQERMDY